MTHKEYSIEGKKVDIFDNAFSTGESFRLLKYAQIALYSVIRVDAAYLPTKQPTLKSNFSQEDIVNSGILKNEVFLNYIIKNKLKVASVGVNLCTASDINDYHIDTPIVGNMTALYYANITWGTNWEGETHLSSDARDIDISCSFIPGRLVIFDGTIPHKSSQPSFNAEEYRYVYVIKMICDKDPRWEAPLSEGTTTTLTENKLFNGTESTFGSW